MDLDAVKVPGKPAPEPPAPTPAAPPAPAPAAATSKAAPVAASRGAAAAKGAVPSKAQAAAAAANAEQAKAAAAKRKKEEEEECGSSESGVRAGGVWAAAYGWPCPAATGRLQVSVVENGGGGGAGTSAKCRQQLTPAGMGEAEKREGNAQGRAYRSVQAGSRVVMAHPPPSRAHSPMHSHARRV